MRCCCCSLSQWQILAIRSFWRGGSTSSPCRHISKSPGNDNLPGGATLAMALLLPSLAVYFLQYYLLRQRSFVALTGRASGAGVQMVDKRVQYPLMAICWGTVGCVFLFYGLVVVGSFTKLWGVDYSLTLNNYVEAFRLRRGLHLGLPPACGDRHTIDRGARDGYRISGQAEAVYRA